MRYEQVVDFERYLAGTKEVSRTLLLVLPEESERHRLVQKISQKTACQIQKFSAESSLAEFIDSLSYLSFLGDPSLLWLEGCESLKKKEQEDLLSLLGISTSHYVVLGSKSKTPLSKEIEKIGVFLNMGEEKPWDKNKRMLDRISCLAKDGGKILAGDAAALLLERIGLDLPLLTQEIEKLLCYAGERPTIERMDVLQISGISHSSTPWQLAEEIVWEGKGAFDEASFHGLFFALRSQLQMGLKITALLQSGVNSAEWGAYFPKVWPKTLEKRKEQARQKGALFFQRGLKTLFQVELLSRSGSTKNEAMFTLLISKLYGVRENYKTALLGKTDDC